MTSIARLSPRADRRSPPRARRLAGLSAAAVFVTALLSTSAWAACAVDSSFCKGCGCKGGPGWRHTASGRCVGFRELAAKCGDPPSPLLCVFENAPGTGANRECALAPARPPVAPPSSAPSRSPAPTAP